MLCWPFYTKNDVTGKQLFVVTDIYPIFRTGSAGQDFRTLEFLNGKPRLGPTWRAYQQTTEMKGKTI